VAGGRHKSANYRYKRGRQKRKGIRRDLVGLMAFLFGNRCLRCGELYLKNSPNRRMSVDHVVPLSQGGEYKDLSNLQPLCRRCNFRKGGKTIDYRPFIPTEEQLWAAVGKEKRCETGRER